MYTYKKLKELKGKIEIERELHGAPILFFFSVYVFFSELIVLNWHIFNFSASIYLFWFRINLIGSIVLRMFRFLFSSPHLIKNSMLSIKYCQITEPIQNAKILFINLISFLFLNFYPIILKICII
jgi:hypothetical protein